MAVDEIKVSEDIAAMSAKLEHIKEKVDKIHTLLYEGNGASLLVRLDRLEKGQDMKKAYITAIATVMGSAGMAALITFLMTAK